MKASTLNELKKELQTLPPAQVLELCLHLAKYKKENKELLSYLLFEAHDEQAYIKDVKEMIEGQFEGMNKSNLYLAKKTIRKVLRTTNKYIKYSSSKQIEVELLIYFCKTLKNTGVPLQTNTALGNLYQRQVLKINKALATLHEDLQHDYLEELRSE
jgi:membrane-anchored protein YejM (alkaline phosphatase superfamily)